MFVGKRGVEPMSIVGPTRLPRLHKAHTDVLFAHLKGTPLLDANDRAVLDEFGKPIYLLPSAAVLKEVREFLKDNQITSEPFEGTPTDSLAKQLTKFEDEDLFLEQSEDPLTPPEVS
jgi:hypothetical protein